MKAYISPDVAKAMLLNRRDDQLDRFDDVKANGYAELMRARAWTYGPQHSAIQIDKDDYLTNGQHRLTAVVLSGLSQWFDIEIKEQ